MIEASNIAGVTVNDGINTCSDLLVTHIFNVIISLRSMFTEKCSVNILGVYVL